MLPGFLLIYYYLFACSLLAIIGKITPSAASTIGVRMLRNVLNKSPSTYIPSKQLAAVTKKHQQPAKIATA